MSSTDDMQVKVSPEIHRLINTIQGKIYEQREKKETYKDIVADALEYYHDKEAWEEEIYSITRADQSTDDDMQVKVSPMYHRLINTIQAKIYEQREKKETYKDIVADALNYYHDKEAWEEEEIVST